MRETPQHPQQLDPDVYDLHDEPEPDRYRQYRAAEFTWEDYDLHEDEIDAIEKAFRKGRRMGRHCVMALISETFERGYQAGIDDSQIDARRAARERTH
jgi:hypothetical protein